MPEKTRTYDYVKFTPDVIKEAENTLVRASGQKEERPHSQSLVIKISSKEKWSHDNEEEFFADYIKAFEYARFYKSYKSGRIDLWAYREHTDVAVEMPSRAEVESVFNVLELNVEKCSIAKPTVKKRAKPKIKIFIGHGRDTQWRDLKDHLHDMHGLDVEHYEHGARAGSTVKEVLDAMLTSSSFALLVLTGEDEDAEGKLHARENVIHELGLFQGRLSWLKAIIILEDGVEEFSNIHGVNQIRFNKGNIQETFGDVLATIKREFYE